MTKYFLVGLLCCLLVSCMPTQKPMQSVASSPNHKLVVYQIFTRLFGNQKTSNQFNGSIETNGVGKLNDITPKALAELKKFGISHVWYTGVIEHANMTDYSAYGIRPDNPLVVKGRAGSPYAIKDYYDINPDLAVDVPNRLAEFDALVKRTHEAGLKVIIDFVPNHVARLYHSDAKPADVADFGEQDNQGVVFSPNNNFYYIPSERFVVPSEVQPPVAAPPFNEYPAKATGNDVFSAKPSINDWFETVKLNYGVDYANNRAKHFSPTPNTWEKMRDILVYWRKRGVDGFRCDMAEMVPVEFWAWAIPQVKAVGETTFIAEIYNPAEYRNYLFVGKFDYLYDKVGLYDALRRLMEGHGSAQDITRVWQQESGDFSERMLRFLENHDEQRIASKFFAKDARIGLPAMMLSATLHGGPLMLYFGQEVGVNPTQAEGFQGDDGRTTIFDYWSVPEYQAWVNNGKFDGGKLTTEQQQLRAAYQAINHFATSNDAVMNGKFWDLQYLQLPNYPHHRCYAYLRYTDKQKLLFVYNFDLANSHQINLKLPTELIGNWSKSESNLLKIKDLSNNALVSLSAETLTSGSGFGLQLPPNSYRIFSIE